MPLPLPNLDDRRWLDLTQEAIPLIPRYAPQWTDFNTHDPGITLMELFAWLTESMVYRVNQVPDRFKWKFLALIGYPARGPKPAYTVLTFQPVPAAVQFEVPAGTQFTAPVAGGNPILFSTVRAIDIAQASLSALQVDTGSGVLRDYSRDLSDGLPVTAMGAAAVPGAALYLGFDVVPTSTPLSMWLCFEGSGHDAAARSRIAAEAAAQREACVCKSPAWPCGPVTRVDFNPCTAAPEPVPPHHSARIVWEAFTGGTWTGLTPVVDDTRSLTLNGTVEVNLPAAITKAALGAVATPLYYLRSRLTGGAYDAPVVLAGVQPNAVPAVQRTPLWQQFTIAGTVLPLPVTPVPGSQISLQFTVSADLTIQSLAAQSPPAGGQPGFMFLNYAAPLAGNTGSVTVEFTVAGIGTAVPSQQVFIPGAPVQAECVRLYTHDGVTWTEWKQTPDFDAARRADLVWTLDPTSGLVTCGDGERGQVFPQGSAIVITGFGTNADSGNVAARKISGLAETPVNTVLLAGVSSPNQNLLSQIVANPVAADGGEPVAPLAELEGEAAQVVHAHERILDLAQNAQQITLDQIPKSAVLALPPPSQAVSLLDTERITLDVPGTFVARARAWSDTDPAFPGIHATGVVTVVILPAMPVAEPNPSPGLIAAVKRYLDRRRVICTRIEVAAPIYVVIRVTATVTSTTGANVTTVQAAILDALVTFLDPLVGGPAQLGWPFGRSVYRAEILQLIASVPGVDYVDSMTIAADGGTPQCGDVPICPTYLVASGSHQIQVVAS